MQSYGLRNIYFCVIIFFFVNLEPTVKQRIIFFFLFLLFSRLVDGSPSRMLQDPLRKSSCPESPHPGLEGKYRRTSSPTICTTPNVKPSLNNKDLNGKSPVRTPKRESPATIAAKGKQASLAKNLF